MRAMTDARAAERRAIALLGAGAAAGLALAALGLLRAPGPEGGLPQFDLTIRNYVTDHGPPDYFRVEDADRVYFYYIDENLVTEFVRSWFDTDSRVTPHRPIPDGHKVLLPLSATRRLKTEPETPLGLESCFTQCRELTDRSKEECFDACRD